MDDPQWRELSKFAPKKTQGLADESQAGALLIWKLISHY